MFKYKLNFIDQLDQAFICLRNASQDDKLDKPSRLHLLEIVELRAGQWNSQDSDSVAYYQRKLSEVEVSCLVLNIIDNVSIAKLNVFNFQGISRSRYGNQ